MVININISTATGALFSTPNDATLVPTVADVTTYKLIAYMKKLPNVPLTPDPIISCYE